MFGRVGEGVAKKRFRSWVAERLWSLFPTVDIERALEECPELLRRRRVVELVILPGRIHAKVMAEEEKQVRVDIGWPAYTDSQWDRMIGILSRELFFLSMLLTGDFPADFDEALSAEGLPLCPRPDELIVTVGGAPMESVTREMALAVTRLCERLDEDPNGIFFLRGKTRDEVMLELWAHRRKGRKANGRRRQHSRVQFAPAPERVEAARVRRYWTVDPALYRIPYSLRADELPASVLKRLDTLPVTDGDENLDRLFEDAYAQVATRAQAYSMGL